jgi:hypothetical protein
MAGWTGQNQKAESECRDRHCARGATLVEVMLAGSILLLMVLSLFEGIAVAARIARENAEYLQADAYAFDLAWKRYNESYAALRNLALASNLDTASSTNKPYFVETITQEAAPMLYRVGAPAKSYTTIRRVVDPNDASAELGVLISVDVKWGELGKIRQLSTTHTATVFKSGSEDG